MTICKKCDREFQPQKGLINYCSLECRNSRKWDVNDKLKKSLAAKTSSKVKMANIIIGEMATKNATIETKCLYCDEPIIHLKHKPKKYHKECWLKCSGGLRANSTIKHRCVYKGVQLDSGSEKEFAIKCDEHNIHWKKNNTIYFEYIGVDNKKHKYYPDFYLKDSDKWVEIKGKLYASKDVNLERKLASVKNITLIYSKEIKKFDYGLLV